jgi:hypothetical protein
MTENNFEVDRDDQRREGENIREGLPGPDWTRDELYERAVWEYQQIEKGETNSPLYWRLGRFLLEVRKGFDVQGWNDWRRQRKLLKRTRCERSMLIARGFESPEELEQLEHLPVLAAVALTAEKLGLEPRQTTAEARLRRRLTSMHKTLQKILDEFPGVAKPDGLGWRIAGVMQKLTALDHERRALEARVAQVVRKRRKRPAGSASCAVGSS